MLLSLPFCCSAPEGRWALRASLLLLSLLLGAPGARAQTPNWQSAIAVTELGSGSNSAYVSATAADGNGNVYVAGGFNGIVNFGAFTLTSTRGTSVYVAKWSPVNGTFVWAESASTYANSIDALAVSGNSVYVCGSFYGPATFGTTSFTSLTPNTSTSDIFVAKLTDAGSTAQFVWAQQAGGLGVDYVNSMAASGNNVYIVGSFESTTVAFGSTTLTKVNPGNFSNDAFVAKLTDAGSAGSFTWAQRLGGANNDYGRAIAATGSAVYIAGGSNSPTLSLGTLSLSNPGNSSSVYVAKLTDTGAAPSFAWVQGVGDGGGEYVTALAVSGPNVYLAGGFYSPSVRIGAVTLSNSGRSSSTDLFLAKLTDGGNSGAITWAQNLGGSESDELTALAVNGTRVYAVGNFTSPTMNLGPLSLNNIGGGNGYPDIYAARLTDLGTSPRFDWAQRAGGLYNDQALPATLAGTTLYVGGFVYTQAYFGAIPFTYPAASFVPFLAGIDDSGVLAVTPATPLAGLSLAPNPAHATTTVRLPAVPGATQATLLLLDALGRPVRTQRLPLGPAGLMAELPLQGLAPGLYHLQVEAGGQRTSRKLAVE